MKKAAWLAAGLAVAGVAHAAELTPVQQQMRSIYQELVETNTTNSIGSCTLAAQKMAKRLKAGGFKDSEMQVIVPPGGPKKAIWSRA
jgi:type II secretory pathway component PulL